MAQETLPQLYESSFDNITIDSQSDNTDRVEYPDLEVDVSVPDEPLDPPCPENSTIRTFNDSDTSPTDDETTPTGGQNTKFVGSWYVDNRNLATCGGCMDTDITAYLQHRLVASTDRKLTRLLKAGKFEALQSPQNSGKFVIKTMGPTDHLGAGPAEIKTTEPERGYRFTYRFKMSFPELSECRHLTIFYFKMVNTQDLVRDYDLAISPSFQIMDKPLVKTIIDNFEVINKASVYKNAKTGAVWNDKVIRNGKTSKMAGHQHEYQVDAEGNGVAYERCSPDGICHSHRIVSGKVQQARGAGGIHHHKMPDVAILTKTTVVDAKVKNVSHLRKAKNITVDLTPRPSDASIQITPTQKYIPFFGLSCDPPTPDTEQETSKARFYFDINVQEILRNTDYGGIFDKNLSDCCRDRIIDLSKILSLEVTRQRTGALDRRDVVVSNDLIKLVAFSADEHNGMFEPYNFIPQYREVAIQDQKTETCNMVTKKIGVLKEIFMDYDMGVRSFTGIDYDFPESGKYEYCVSIKVRNGITIFLNEKLGELLDMRKKVTKWSEFSSNPDYVDKTTNTFKKKYKDLINCNPKGRIDADEGDNPYLTITDDAIVLLAEVLECLTNYEHLDKIPMVEALYAATNAETGNIDGIQTLIKIYDLLITELRKTLGNKELRTKGGKIINNATDYQYGITHGSKADKETIEFKKCFKDIDCPCVNEGTWFDFLGAAAQDAEGVKQISPDDYNKRALAENDKYFGSSGTAAAAGSSTLELTSLINGGSSEETLTKISSLVSKGGFSSYLTPKQVKMGNKRYDLSKLRQDPSYYNNLYNLSQQGGSAKLYQKGQTTSPPPGPNINDPQITESSNSTSQWEDDSSTVDAAQITGDDNAFINVGLGDDSDNNSYQALSPEDDMKQQDVLDRLISGCAPPCGDEIVFVHQGLKSSGLNETGASLPSSSSTGQMPPQLLSLMGAPTTEVQLKTIPQLQSMLLFNYNIMVIVEALSYVSTPSGMFKKWIPVTAEMVSSAANSPILCRMRKYSERKWGMRDCPEFNVSVCDSYFILGNPSTKIEHCNDQDATIKNHLIDQQKVYRNAQVGSVNDEQKVNVEPQRKMRLLL